ncbi:MAG: hypothetical protein ABII76_11615 [Pseudomonadota bacterium]
MAPFHEVRLTVACLGWGSLVWKPEDLPLRGEWTNDGPFLPIEFARESNRRRITLVVVDGPEMVQSLWAPMAASTLEAAKGELAKREGITDENIVYSIGWWDRASGQHHGRSSAIVAAWAAERNLDAVVWTNLKPGFRASRGTLPTYEQVLAHLRGLENEEKDLAEEYVRKAPAQVATPYREGLVRDLGWSLLAA